MTQLCLTKTTSLWITSKHLLTNLLFFPTTDGAPFVAMPSNLEESIPNFFIDFITSSKIFWPVVVDFILAISKNSSITSKLFLNPRMKTTSWEVSLKSVLSSKVILKAEHLLTLFFREISIFLERSSIQPANETDIFAPLSISCSETNFQWIFSNNYKVVITVWHFFFDNCVRYLEAQFCT